MVIFSKQPEAFVKFATNPGLIETSSKNGSTEKTVTIAHLHRFVMDASPQMPFQTAFNFILLLI